jgi:hypothetical protein
MNRRTLCSLTIVPIFAWISQNRRASNIFTIPGLLDPLHWRSKMGDYHNADEAVPSQYDAAYMKLKEHEAGREVYLPSEDPFGLYNHCVNQFNARCNRTTSAPLEKLDRSCFYALWMIRWWVRLRAYKNPCFFAISVILSTAFGLIPIVNLAHFMVWLICWILYERQAPLHARNKLKS